MTETKHSSNLTLFKGEGDGLSQNWPKGEGIQFFFNKGRDIKKGWYGVTMGGIKKIYRTLSISLKEIQTFKAY